MRCLTGEDNCKQTTNSLFTCVLDLLDTISTEDSDKCASLRKHVCLITDHHNCGGSPVVGGLPLVEDRRTSATHWCMKWMVQNLTGQTSRLFLNWSSHSPRFRPVVLGNNCVSKRWHLNAFFPACKQRAEVTQTMYFKVHVNKKMLLLCVNC